MGHQKNIRESVLRLSMMCREAGMDGVVASPQEASAIRALCGNDFLIVTPGIRPLNQEHGDQTRTATPAEAQFISAMETSPHSAAWADPATA